MPSGTVPALIHGGFTLSESDAIAEYINDLQPEPAMLPTDIKKRATARAFSRFHDTRIEPLIRLYFPHVSRSTRSTSFVAENTDILQKRFYQFAKMATPQPFLAGENLCLADCGFVPSFAILRCLQPILNFKIKLPRSMKKYEMDLIAHPSVRKEYNNYIGALNEWTDNKLSKI